MLSAVYFLCLFPQGNFGECYLAEFKGRRVVVKKPKHQDRSTMLVCLFVAFFSHPFDLLTPIFIFINRKCKPFVGCLRIQTCCLYLESLWTLTFVSSRPMQLVCQTLVESQD